MLVRSGRMNAQSQAPSAESTAAPAPTASVVVERPESPLARGSVPVPAWVVGALGTALIVAVAAFFWWRHRRHARVNKDSMPPSSPLSSRR